MKFEPRCGALRRNDGHRPRVTLVTFACIGALAGCGDTSAPRAASGAPLGSPPSHSSSSTRSPGETPPAAGSRHRGDGSGMGTGGEMAMGGGAKGAQPHPRFPPWRLTPEAEAASARAERESTPPNPPESAGALATSPADVSRCAEGSRSRLFLVRGDEILLDETTDALMQRPDTVTPSTASGRPGRLALPLARLLPDDVAQGRVLVYPCVGEPHAFDVPSLRGNPERILMQVNQRSQLKLVDMEAPPDRRRRFVRNVAAIVVP